MVQVTNGVEPGDRVVTLGGVGLEDKAKVRVMKPGAELRFGTDDAGYLAWTLERLLAHPALEWTAESAADWTSRPANWPQTRYEAKALHGPPAYLRFRRKAKL